MHDGHLIPDAAALDALLTPIALLQPASGVIVHANPAFARWLGVGVRRLRGLAVAALLPDGRVLAGQVRDAGASEHGHTLCLRRQRLGWADRQAQLADLWLSRRVDGLWCVEAHPESELPGLDPAAVLPTALAAAFKGLAHELRNPLAGLKGAAQLLQRREQDAVTQELVGVIGNEADRLGSLLERFLQPQPQRPPVPVNIHAVAEQVLQLASHDAGWSVKLARDYDPSLPALPGDPERLTQALWNLLRNALQAGAGTVTIRTRAEHAVRIGDAVHALALRLEVVDDGSGVPDSLAEHLFLPLVSGRAEGSGLGLALAQQVVREHGGWLGYRSRPGHTVFTLLMPMPTADAP